MEHKIYECLLSSFQNTKQAVFFYQKYENTSFFSNKTAAELYGNQDGILDISSLFPHKESNPFLNTHVTEKLEKESYITVYDVETVTIQGKILICDIEISYVDQKQEILCVQMSGKVGSPMDIALSQLNQSPRAEAILQFDERLTLVACNEHFSQAFAKSKEEMQAQYDNQLANAFPAEIRESLLREIQENLRKSATFSTKIKLNTSMGNGEWYYMDFHLQSLDNSSLDKVMVFLVNTENPQETDEKLNEYFNVLQNLSNGLVYRFDIHQRKLYRNESTADAYSLPTMTENFPNPQWLEAMVHPEDWDAAILYINGLIQGNEGSKTVRLKTVSGNFEYHKFTFQAMHNGDGSIREMLGFAKNIHKLKEVESKLLNINQYFNIIQKETLCTVLRYDIKNRILHRNADLAKEHGLPTFIEDYPNQEQVNRAVHPDYRQGYFSFFDQVISGEEGCYHALLLTVDDSYEYHSINARAIRNSDGSIHEMLLTVFNVNDLTETETLLSQVNQHFDAMQKLSDDLLFRIDLKTKMFTCHGIKVKLFGLTEETVPFPEALYDAGSIYDEDKWTFEEFVQQVFLGEEGTIEIRMRERDHENFAYRRISWTPIEQEEGKVTQVVGKLTNVQAVKDLEEQANYDSLTRALNKRAIAESTTQLINRAKEGEKHALLFLDLDDFKYVNDNLGHSFGDFLLRKLGARIRECIRYHDLVGRVGGDEFVIVLRDVQSIDILLGKAKLLLSSISEDIVDGEKRHSIHGSIGIAVYPEHGKSYEELYHYADVALYQSKHKGKNTVQIYEHGMQ